MPPKTFVARINYKPLALDEVERLKPERVLKYIQREVLRAIRSRIQVAAFSAEAKKALSQGMRTKIGPRSLTIEATHPAFFPLIRGQARGQMTWLRGARAPIPIVRDDGKVIFRTATAKSMKDGKWIHPGHKSTTIIEEARKEAREIVKKRMKKEIQRQIRAAIGKSR